MEHFNADSIEILCINQTQHKIMKAGNIVMQNNNKNLIYRTYDLLHLAKSMEDIRGKSV